MDSPANLSLVRMKIIKRFGDGWLYLFFFICAHAIRNYYRDIVDNPDSCSEGLSGFLNAYYKGYCVYLVFLAVTLLGFCYPKLESSFRICNGLFFIFYFFGLFIYANLVLYNINDDCKTQYREIRLFAIAYVIAWYCYITTRLLMLVMYRAKKNLTGRLHDLEGTSLFVDVD
mgnify:CR=1 FL=1